MSSNETTTNLQNQELEGGRFVVGRPIGKGSFGDVYEGYDRQNRQRVAIKFEDRKSSHSQLKNEYRVSTTHFFRIAFMIVVVFFSWHEINRNCVHFHRCIKFYTLKWAFQS